MRSNVLDHAAPLVVHAAQAPLPLPDAPVCSDAFLRAAGYAGRLLDPAAHDALIDFADDPHPSGALLLRGMPIGVLPPTPPTPTTPTTKDATSEMTLLTAARRLGHPVGYEPEHGGDVVQHLVPTRSGADRQVSTSSKVTLMFHTEAAFHPHRPRYLLLICLRGDPDAATTLASIREVLPVLDPATRDVLFEPRFRTAVDESYLHGRANVLGVPMPVLRGLADTPTMVFDAELMVGIDLAAERALRELSAAVESHHTAAVLEPGDLLVVDNELAVHGRTSYAPRFDGSDRWLQRAMVVTDLAPSAADRRGRSIVTQFGA